MNDQDTERAQSRVTLAVDSIGVPPGPGHLRALQPRNRVLTSLVTAGAAALFLLAFALVLGTLRSTNDQAARPSQTIAPTPALSVAVPASPSASPKADRTTSSIAAAATRARWAISGTTVFAQPEAADFSRTAAEEVRIVDGSGRLQATASVREAVSGEPVICGTPDIRPPLIAALAVSTAVRDDFVQTGGPKTYHFEVREGTTWHSVTPIDWRTLPEKPCVAQSGGTALFFPAGPIDFCALFVSYRAPTSTVSGELRMGGTTFAVSSGNPAPFSQTVMATAGTWSCLHGSVVSSETQGQLLTNFQVDPAPDGRVQILTNVTACGTIAEVFVGDLPSGGYITLEGTKFLVGGARRPGEGVQLPASGLRPGVKICLEKATFRPTDMLTYDVTGGSVVIR